MLRFIPAILLASALTSSAQIAVWPLPSPPPGTPKAQFPTFKTEWFDHFQHGLNKLKQGPYDVIFDGASITEFWERPDRGLPVWKAHYGALKAVDLGIGGDEIQNLLWRLQNGELAGQNPKLIVLQVGNNNIDQPPEGVAGGMKLVLEECEKRCPDAHILLIGIFPRGAAPGTSTRDWGAKVNRILATYDDGKRVTYLDVGVKFLEPDGTLTHEMSVDFLHPTTKGYEVWADAMQPVFDQYVLKK